MIVFPLAATAVSAVFAVLLFKRYGAKRRMALLAWGIAMVQFALASATVAMGVSGGWDPTLYRLFWLFGAMLNVPWLALGSVSLVSRSLVTRVVSAVVVVLTTYAFVAVAQASPDAGALAAETGIPRGSEVWGEGAAMLTLARAYSIVAWLVVVAIAITSSRPHKGVRPPSSRVRANALIAVGVSLVAVGGFALSRIGQGEAFSITLAAGIAIMFAGFLMAGRAPRFRVEDPGDSPT